jgi:AraC-like DNA-binding protein/ligand-binding sensor protein
VKIQPSVPRAVTKSAGLCAAALGTHATLLDSSLEPAETLSHEDDRSSGTLCQLVNAHPEGAAQCRAARESGARRAIQLGGAYFYACHTDLVEGIVPVQRNGTVPAYVVIGPIMLAPVDQLLKDRIVGGVSAFGVSENQARQAIACVPVVEAERLKRTLNLLAELVADVDIAPEGLARTASQQDTQTGSVAPARSHAQHKVANGAFLKQRFALAHARVASPSEIRQDLCDIMSGKLEGNFNVDIARAAALETVAALWRTFLDQDGRAHRSPLTATAVVALFRTKTCADAVDWASETIRRMGRQAKPVSSHELSVLRQVRNYVRGSLTQRLSCSTVAHEVGMEPHELDRMFRSCLDITFKQYLTLERLACARKLLHESKMTATQVAAATGFSDQSNFTKVFERVERVTPIQYRTRSVAAQPYLTKRTSTRKHPHH